MTRKEELLAAFDDVWSHRWESMGKLFDDISDEEANFQHESYVNAERYPKDPESGTILWYVHHLAHCYRYYINVITMHPERPEAAPHPAIESIGALLDVMKHDRAALRDAITAVPDDQLDEKVYNGDTIAAFVRMVTRHDAWHSGQVAVARRLYRTRPT